MKPAPASAALVLILREMGWAYPTQLAASMVPMLRVQTWQVQLWQAQPEPEVLAELQA